MRTGQRHNQADFLRYTSASVGLFSLLALAAIMFFLFASGLPLFSHETVTGFLFGSDWSPTDAKPVFGILPMIAGSVAVTFLSACFAVPLGLMTALFLTELAKEKWRRICKPIIELLAALPSVVIGFFGMVVFGPFLEHFLDLDTGLNLLTAALMLAFMSVPTICSISEDALRAVPRSLREGSLALGATRFETIWKVVLPSAKSGIATAVILGMSRSIGETMVVLMVAGGAGIIPHSIFDPVRPMTSTIAAEMAETPVGSEHYFALFSIGIVLFLFCLLFNLLAHSVASRPLVSGKPGRRKKFAEPDNAAVDGLKNTDDPSLPAAPARQTESFSVNDRRAFQIGKRLFKEQTAFLLLKFAAFCNFAALFSIIFMLVYNGLPVMSFEFLTAFPKDMMTAGGIWPCIVGTVILSLGSLALAFPLGVLTAIYLHEYASRSRLASYIRMGVNNLAGVPSVVFGLFGFSFFSIFCGLGVSMASGILTLMILTLPVIISTAEEALRQVPDTLREASLALGATKQQTIVRAILPVAMPGMLTGAILGMARAAGETAAIMFTAAVIFTPSLPESVLSPLMALPYHVYTLATTGIDIEKTIPLQYGTALVLVALVLGMNLVAIIVRDKMQSNRSM